ncbi:MAG: 30S ribosome-binding factor RbfA [Caldicoprobacter oshimai]|uniref:Ribosome-binding factor A n=1 Tax=Caldicoprobacter faecalis TaxID=937334 RepID=A0A1I5RQU9_9FIRM|nr:30S ribosome-binding factor RbfA [Caldicoprobacter faecalis]PZN10814.1 MAG: 30S ribosome-binding factor RbfA [Caldicoprobacter oshimai]SFP60929.1 ribosome-binding factor A [Caldicoprobacter faecalis]
MSYQRAERIAEEIKRELSDILRSHVRDPRITEMVSVVKVEVSKDLRHAKIYVSVLGDKEEKQKTMEGLDRATGFIRKELGQRLGLRYVPEIRFILDESIEYSIHIAQKIEELKKKEQDENQ